MELCSEPEWLLLQILCGKARPIGPFGQAIELWVCAQHFVCVGGLAWSRMGLCSRRASTTPRTWRASSRRTKTTCMDPCANQIHSRSCLALNNQPLPFFLATLHLLTLKHTLGLLHRLNAQLRQRQKKDHPTHIHTHNAAHIPKARSPVQTDLSAEPSRIKSATTTTQAQSTAPSPATEATAERGGLDED